jgi:hypothetical protein
MSKPDNSGFLKEVAKVAKDKNDLKTLADAVGMPDDQDKARIRQILMTFDKKHPGQIFHTVQKAREDFRAQGGDVAKYGLVNKQASGRTLFELPEALVGEIETEYPTMFREKKHFHWFVRHFKELLIPEKY